MYDNIKGNKRRARGGTQNDFEQTVSSSALIRHLKYTCAPDLRDNADVVGLTP